MNWIAAAIGYRIIRGSESDRQKSKERPHVHATVGTMLFAGTVTLILLMIPILLALAAGSPWIVLVFLPSLVIVVFFTIDSFPKKKNHGQQIENQGNGTRNRNG